MKIGRCQIERQVHSGRRYSSICTCIHVFAAIQSTLTLSFPSQLPGGSSLPRYLLNYARSEETLNLLTELFFGTSTPQCCCHLCWSHVVSADMIDSDRDEHNGEHECLTQEYIDNFFSIMTERYFRIIPIRKLCALPWPLLHGHIKEAHRWFDQLVLCSQRLTRWRSLFFLRRLWLSRPEKLLNTQKACFFSPTD